MTPADAAREVAERASVRAQHYSYDDPGYGRYRWEAVADAFKAFAELLDRAPVEEIRTFPGNVVRYVPAHADPCPDGLSCPLADDYPAAHGIGVPLRHPCCRDFPCCPCD